MEGNASQEEKTPKINEKGEELDKEPHQAQMIEDNGFKADITNNGFKADITCKNTDRNDNHRNFYAGRNYNQFQVNADNNNNRSQVNTDRKYYRRQIYADKNDNPHCSKVWETSTSQSGS